MSKAPFFQARPLARYCIDVCGRMLTYADVCLLMRVRSPDTALTYADVC